MRQKRVDSGVFKINQVRLPRNNEEELMLTTPSSLVQILCKGCYNTKY